MQKFIHDNEQYVLEVKKKHGKTKIDKELNEYLRKKKNNNLNEIEDGEITNDLINTSNKVILL